MKKLIWLLVFWLLLCTVLFAGAIVVLDCDSCGFKSNEVTEGSGKAGVDYTIVFCNTCRNFYYILTSKTFISSDMWKIVKDRKVIQPIGKKEFLGAVRYIYPCPKCGSEAFAYAGPVCPICLKGTLVRKLKALWD